MVHRWTGVLLAVGVGTGCAGSGAAIASGPPRVAAGTSAPLAVAATTEPTSARLSDERPDGPRDGAWIGAAAESDVLLAGTTDTALGVWVDAPAHRGGTHAPIDLALVVDTSGSMAGSKIESARAAARELVSGLADGDIVSLATFSDAATSVVSPVALSALTRPGVLAAIDRLATGGGTNLHAGLSLGEINAMTAPESHPVRRLVVLSDGIANVGLTSPEMLGALVEKGLRAHVQVTSLGVGIDYDERTLDALAVRTSGRLYHLGDPRAMAAALHDELGLLTGTVASDAVLEVVPAPGVRLTGADGARFDWGGSGTLRIPLGALYGGQHREALVRVHVDPSVFVSTRDSRPLASVRLRFRDPADGDVERVQEVVARAGLTDDAREVAARGNARTQSIATIQEAAKLELAASDAANRGELQAATVRLAQAETTIREQAHKVADPRQKKRLEEVAGTLARSRASAGAAAAAPKAVQRDEALKMNSAALDLEGY